MWGAILLGGGSGSRMGAGRNKVLLPLGGIPVIRRSALALRPRLATGNGNGDCRGGLPQHADDGSARYRQIHAGKMYARHYAAADF